MLSIDVHILSQLLKFIDVFSEKIAQELLEYTRHDHTIKLVRGNPPKISIYKLSEKKLGVLRKYLDRALGKEWIHRSTSPTSTPILFMSKKDRLLRIWVDYQDLNNKTQKNAGLLPLIWELFNQLHFLFYFI